MTAIKSRAVQPCQAHHHRESSTVLKAMQPDDQRYIVISLSACCKPIMTPFMTPHRCRTCFCWVGMIGRCHGLMLRTCFDACALYLASAAYLVFECQLRISNGASCGQMVQQHVKRFVGRNVACAFSSFQPAQCVNSRDRGFSAEQLHPQDREAIVNTAASSPHAWRKQRFSSSLWRCVCTDHGSLSLQKPVSSPSPPCPAAVSVEPTVLLDPSRMLKRLHVTGSQSRRQSASPRTAQCVSAEGPTDLGHRHRTLALSPWLSMIWWVPANACAQPRPSKSSSHQNESSEHGRLALVYWHDASCICMS